MPLPSENGRLKGRPEAENLVGIYAALSGQTVDQVLAQFGGGQFSRFKKALADLAVAKLWTDRPGNATRLAGDPGHDRGRFWPMARRGRGRIAAPILPGSQENCRFCRGLRRAAQL